MTDAFGDNFRLVPPQSSTMAAEFDHLFCFELLVAVFFTGLIFVLVVGFSLYYRRRSPNEFPGANVQNMGLEIAWTIVPFLFMLCFFVWGVHLFARMKRPPEHAITINVIGKQWMWKAQHSNGAREIDALHVPVGQPVKLLMASQDVIHSFFIPAFRIKQDVVPGSFETQWFVATQPGRFHLFCSQYCGAEHAKMVGEVVALPPAEYQAWLAGAPTDEPPVAAGEKLFNSWGCNACHGQRAPTLAGLYLSKVPLDDGTTAIADEDYLRESIIEPSAKIVAGYPPIMPSYRGQLSEEQIVDLVEYIKSLGATAAADGPRFVPATQPINGVNPGHLPNYPPARQPPASAR